MSGNAAFVGLRVGQILHSLVVITLDKHGSHTEVRACQDVKKKKNFSFFKRPYAVYGITAPGTKDLFEQFQECHCYSYLTLPVYH